jgi:alkanesulfonate monooxygenase
MAAQDRTTDELDVYWYINAPDGRRPWAPDGSRPVDLAYFRQLAGAVDHLGFTGALLATGAHEPWILATTLAATTERMRFLVALHPPLISPVLAAKLTATLDQFSRGRVLLNIVNGDSAQMRAYGSPLSHDDRYAYTDEWIPAWRAAITGEELDLDGRFVSAHGRVLRLDPVQQPHPPLWFGGSSPAALETAARHVDVHLSWGEPPAQTAQKIAQLRELAGAHGRELRFGIRLYVIVRDTDEEAWAQADWLMAGMDDDAIERIQAASARSESVGQQRINALRASSPHGKPRHARELEVHPGLWAGLSLVRSGPGTAIVGSPETVLRTIDEYREAGISAFILSGIPLLEEAYRFGESVLPHLTVARHAGSGPQPADHAAFTWANRAVIAGSAH